MIKINLTKGKFAIINKSDLEKISGIKWHYQEKRKTGYAIRSVWIDGKQTTQRMHRLIINAKIGEIIDHINGDGLDNRSSNLRIVSHRENCINRRSKSKKFGYKGVSKNGRRYLARIGDRNNHRTIGYFETAEAAAKAYDREASLRYGNFAVLNFQEK